MSFRARLQRKLCLDLTFRFRRTSPFHRPHERSSCIRGITGAVRRYRFQLLGNLFDNLEAQLGQKKDGENCTVVIYGTAEFGFWVLGQGEFCSVCGVYLGKGLKENSFLPGDHDLEEQTRGYVSLLGVP